MNFFSKRPLLFLLTLALLFPSCKNFSCAKSSENKEEKLIESNELSAAAPKLPALTKVLKFPGLSFAGLSTVQKNTLVNFFNQEPSPCGCKESFAKSIKNSKGCPQAKLLAGWMIKNLNEGAPERYLFQAVSDEIKNGLNAPVKTIELEGAHQKGKRHAPITIVEFADFECPSCKIAAEQIDLLLQSQGNKIDFYFHHFPLTQHPNAEPFAHAAQAAAKLGKFWSFHDRVYQSEEPLSENTLQEIARSIFTKEEMVKFSAFRKDMTLLESIRERRSSAINYLKISSTPTLFINSRPYFLSLDKDAMALRIQFEIMRAKIQCES